MKSIKHQKKQESVGRVHSRAMLLTDLRKIWMWSVSNCDAGALMAISASELTVPQRAHLTEHLLWRAFSSLAWMLWTR